VPIRGKLQAEEQGTRRSATRRKLQLDLTGETATGAGDVTVLNLSSSGTLLRTAQPLRVGERVRLAFPGDAEAGAKVVWAGDGLFGCRFEKPLDQATLSAARLKSRIDAPDEAIIETPAARSSPEETFGTRLKRLRMQRGIGLMALARLLGVSKPAVWKWERDQVRPRPDTLGRLAEVLQVSPSELVFGAHAEGGQAADRPPGPPALRSILERAKADVARLFGLNPSDVTVTVAIRD
jgi:transcriptional regulator with XRE-family HTH domain